MLRSEVMEEFEWWTVSSGCARMYSGQSSSH